MRLSMNEELERGWTIIAEGNLNEAIKLVENFEKNDDLTLEDEHYCSFLKGIIFLHMGRNQESIQIAEKLYQKTNIEKKPLFAIDAIILKWSNFYAIGRYLDLWEEILKCEKLLKSELQETPTEVQFRQGWIDCIIGAYFLWEGEFDKAVNHQKKSLSFKLETFSFC